MEKKNKIILISVILITVLAIIIGMVIVLVNKNDSKEPQVGNSKTINLYNTLSNKESYSFTTELDDNNKMNYTKKDNMAYINDKYDGDDSEYIIKEGNTYLVDNSKKVYYTYQNNETDLNKVETALEDIKDLEYIQDTEEIEGKKYKYEEYSQVTDFLFKDIDESEEMEVKTRFYFDGNKLVYIKTIVADYQELLKVDISYKVDENLFKIPSDYIES